MLKKISEVFFLTDEKWVLDAPESKYLTGDVAENTANIQAELEENLQQMAVQEFVAVDNVEMKGPAVVAAPVGTFLSDLKSSGDVQHHPLAWALSLLVVAPGVILGIKGVSDGAALSELMGIGSDSLSYQIVTMLVDFVVIGQLVLGPGVCAAMARRTFLGPAVFVAMGSSAVLLLNNQVIIALAEQYDIIAVLACIVCMSPLVIVLRNKRMQLPAGRARHTWAFLMSVSILMFASATMVAAIQDAETLTSIDGWNDTMAWSSLLLIAGAIGWAWPKGAELVEEVAEEIIEKAV